MTTLRLEKTKIMRNLVSFLLFLSGTALVGQNSSAPQSPDQEKAQCVRMLRDVNNAEMRYRAANRHFGTLSELSRSGDLKSNSAELFNNSAARTKFRLFVSDNGSSYETVAVHRASDATWGFFSDESGLIYQAEPLQ